MLLCSFLVAQTVKSLPAMQETWVRSLNQKDPMKKEIATHSSTLTWRIPMDGGAWQATGPWGRKDSDTTERLTLSLYKLT